MDAPKNAQWQVVDDTADDRGRGTWNSRAQFSDDASAQ